MDKLQNQCEIKCEDLIKYLPKYYHESSVIKRIMEVEGCQIGTLLHQICDYSNQFLISTATWGLDIYEKELGIYHNVGLPFDRRREIIIAKLRGRGTTTKEMIKNTAEAFSGGEVEVEEINEEYTFVIKFTGVTGVPSNMEDFWEMLENIKPAHLQYEIEYTYVPWGKLKNRTWGSLQKFTWGEVPESQELIGG